MVVVIKKNVVWSLLDFLFCDGKERHVLKSISMACLVLVGNILSVSVLKKMFMCWP